MTSLSTRYAALQQEIDAMVEELRGLNDPMVPCWACFQTPDGKATGYQPWHKHVEDGICFTCNGTGEVRNAELPEDMGQCEGCDYAFASGLIWDAGPGTHVCPYCWEDIHGHPRWETFRQREDREIAEAEAYAEQMRETPCSYRAHTDADHQGCHLIEQPKSTWERDDMWNSHDLNGLY
jgi:hypothetical protein